MILFTSGSKYRPPVIKECRGHRSMLFIYRLDGCIARSFFLMQMFFWTNKKKKRDNPSASGVQFLLVNAQYTNQILTVLYCSNDVFISIRLQVRTFEDVQTTRRKTTKIRERILPSILTVPNWTIRGTLFSRLQCSRKLISLS